MRAERVTASITYHGEGPVWWPATGEIRFVDMLAGDVLSGRPGEPMTRIPTGSPVVACLRPRQGGGAVVALERAIALAALDDLSDLRPAVEVFSDPGIRFNEGGCGPSGRFYCGTMAYEKTPGAGTLYRYDGSDSPVVTVLTGVTISNGLGWSPDGSRGYYIDTRTGAVAAFSETPDGLADRRAFVTIPDEDGHPDGLCVDAEGGVWVALNGGSAVHRYDPDGGLSEVVEVPVRKVTACTFGGEDMSTLFITTSRENLPDDEEPAAGSLYAVETGVRGLPPLTFAG